MSDELASRVKDDFFHARFKAFLNGVQAALTGRPDTLLSYDEVRKSYASAGRSIAASRLYRLRESLAV